MHQARRARTSPDTRAACDGQLLGADHHRAPSVGRELADLAAAGELAAAQHRHLVGEAHHLAELVGDHQDAQLAARRVMSRSRPSTSSASCGVSTEVGSSRIRNGCLR